MPIRIRQVWISSWNFFFGFDLNSESQNYNWYIWWSLIALLYTIRSRWILYTISWSYLLFLTTSCNIIPYAINRFKRKKKFVVLHTSFERVNTTVCAIVVFVINQTVDISRSTLFSSHLFLSYLRRLWSKCVLLWRLSMCDLMTTTDRMGFRRWNWFYGQSSSNKGKHPYFTRLAKSGLSPNLRSHGNQFSASSEKLVFIFSN